LKKDAASMSVAITSGQDAFGTEASAVALKNKY
jgi:hypothetical protein